MNYSFSRFAALLAITTLITGQAPAEYRSGGVSVVGTPPSQQTPFILECQAFSLRGASLPRLWHFFVHGRAGRAKILRSGPPFSRSAPRFSGEESYGDFEILDESPGILQFRELVNPNGVLAQLRLPSPFESWYLPQGQFTRMDHAVFDHARRLIRQDGSDVRARAFMTRVLSLVRGRVPSLTDGDHQQVSRYVEEMKKQGGISNNLRYDLTIEGTLKVLAEKEGFYGSVGYIFSMLEIFSALVTREASFGPVRLPIVALVQADLNQVRASLNLAILDYQKRVADEMLRHLRATDSAAQFSEADLPEPARQWARLDSSVPTDPVLQLDELKKLANDRRRYGLGTQNLVMLNGLRILRGNLDEAYGVAHALATEFDPNSGGNPLTRNFREGFARLRGWLADMHSRILTRWQRSPSNNRGDHTLTLVTTGA